MREVFVNQDHAQVGYYKSVLEGAGIPTFIRNESSHNSLTELPSPLFFPALCVVHDPDYDKAMEILAEMHDAPQSNAPDWRCPHCSEDVPGNFDSCWQCGTLHTDCPGNTNESRNT